MGSLGTLMEVARLNFLAKIFAVYLYKRYSISSGQTDTTDPSNL